MTTMNLQELSDKLREALRKYGNIPVSVCFLGNSGFTLSSAEVVSVTDLDTGEEVPTMILFAQG